MITLLEATERTGKSRSTLTRAIRSGKLTANRDDDDKTYLVDPAELARVFPPESVRQDSPHDDSPANHDREIELLESQIDALQDERRREREHMLTQIDDLKKQRDHWIQQNNNATILLQHEQQQSARSWWSKVFG